MIRRNPVMAALAVFGTIALSDLALLVSGYRILVHESRGFEQTVAPHFMTGTPGDGYETLQCSYFTGRNVLTSSFPADSDDECRFIYTPYV